MNKNTVCIVKSMLLASVLIVGLQACTVIRVVDAAASTTIGVAKGTAKVTGKVAGAAIPDGDKKKKDDD